LIDKAVAGLVDLDTDGTPAGETTLVRLQLGDPATAALLDTAFHGRDRLSLGAYDEGFARMWVALGRSLSAWRDTSGLWDAAADRRARWVQGVGAVVGVLGVALAVLGGRLSVQQTGLALVLAGLGGALAGAGAAAAVRGWELRVFTPTGSAAWLQVEALRRFLAQSPPTAVDEAVSSRQAGRYAAWAVALGEAERWSRLVSDLTSATRDRSQAPYDARGVLYAGYAPVFVTHCCTASTAPSASSGGSGAGVGVGGGAGGGGGGSW
jgi:Predicted membrane protein (DUF2207)